MTLDTDLIYAEIVEIDRGDGFRLHTSQEDVYEAVENEHGRASRIHPEEEGWRSTVRVPAGGSKQETYRRFRDIADALEDAYDSDLGMDWMSFHTAYDSDRIRATDDDIQLQYNKENGIAIPKKYYDTAGKSGAVLGGLGAIGVGVAGIGGLLAPPVVLPIVLGGLPAGAVLGYAAPKTREKITNWRRKRKYGDADRLQDASIIEAYNELHSLDRLLRLDEPFPDDLMDRYNDLEEEEIEDAVDLMLSTHFGQFAEAKGITATASFDTYEEAAAFQDHVRGKTPKERDRPSFYTSPDAFRGMFSSLVHEIDGTTHLLDDARTMVAAVLQKDTPQEIHAFLDQEHPELVEEIGRERALGDDTA